MGKTKINHIDISLPIHSEMIVWQGEFAPEIVFDKTIKEGHESNNSSIKMDVHTGTHMDAPLHFIEDGKRLDEMDLSLLIGETYVFETSADVITREVLSHGNIPKTERLLIKTKNNDLYKRKYFETDFVALDESAADWILENNIRLIGLDYLSVELFVNQEIGYPVHKKLLSKEVVLLEGLVLNDVPPGFYKLTALPIRLIGTEAAPVRAILFPIKNK